MASTATLTILRTLTGSEYRVRQLDDGSWFVTGGNRPSATSASLRDEWWPIDPPAPWPPVLGHGLCFCSVHVAAPIGSPGRMPGGSKATSPVLAIETVRGDIVPPRPICTVCGGTRGAWMRAPVVVHGVEGQPEPAGLRVEIPVLHCADCQTASITARAPAVDGPVATDPPQPAVDIDLSGTAEDHHE